ncbi:MAG: sulfatase [Planctomycetota bacterium]
MQKHRPNILLLHSHDTGRCIQPYGEAIPTPHLQRFAEQGVVFRHAFCAGPTCSPSRAALMTGRFPHQVGMFGLAHLGWTLNADALTMPQHLQAAGFHTTLGGFQHIASWKGDAWRRLGYDERLEAAGDTGSRRADEACAFLKRTHSSPFFLDVGFTETHRSAWIDHEGSRIQWHNGPDSPTGDPRYVRPPATLPDEPITRRDFADFAESVKRLDHLYGTILDGLDASEYADNTIVVITTDHGIAFPRMKCNLTDHGTGVLLMMRGPAEYGLTGGKVIDAMVSQMDVLPTLLEWIGIESDSPLEGVSLNPTLNNTTPAQDPTGLRDAIFSEINYHNTREIERAIRTERYKYIRCYDDEPVARHSCDGSTSRDLMTAFGWGDRPLPTERLYDLVFDPTEACNLATDPRLSSVVADLRGRLESWMRQTNDPALLGSVPEPVAG